MSLVLRGYQGILLDSARDALKVYRRILIVSPTGSGKTALIVSMMGQAAERGVSSVFCVHQNELLQQTSRALWEQRLEHGVIASGKRKSQMPAQVASVQTLVRRLDNYSEPRMIIIDEAHRSAADTYGRILAAWPNALVIGLTATAERTDGKGLGAIFNTIVQGPQIAELIEQGYLCDYTLMAPPSLVDLTGIKTTAGDFDAAETERRVDTPVITGNAVEHYLEHANGKRCVVMCRTIKHAGHVADEYNSRGIPAAVIHGELSNPERETMLQQFKAGALRVLANVNLLIEGVDIPSIEVVQWLRPTKSLIIWMQGNGRGLRPHAGKERLLILDHVGNWSRPGFGLPDAPRSWSLDGRKARTAKAEDGESFDIRQCPQCFAIYRSSAASCPTCSAPAASGAGKSEIEVVEGKLAVIEREAARKAERIEQGMAKSLRDLVQLGIRKGIKHADAWAANVHAGRSGQKPTKADYDLAAVFYSEAVNWSAELWPV